MEYQFLETDFLLGILEQWKFNNFPPLWLDDLKPLLFFQYPDSNANLNPNFKVQKFEPQIEIENAILDLDLIPQDKYICMPFIQLMQKVLTNIKKYNADFLDKHLDFRFFICDGERMNVDKTVITVGKEIFKSFESEDMLAFALGHEIMHFILSDRKNWDKSSYTEETICDFFGAILAARAGYSIDSSLFFLKTQALANLDVKSARRNLEKYLLNKKRKQTKNKQAFLSNAEFYDFVQQDPHPPEFVRKIGLTLLSEYLKNCGFQVKETIPIAKNVLQSVQNCNYYTSIVDKINYYSNYNQKIYDWEVFLSAEYDNASPKDKNFLKMQSLYLLAEKGDKNSKADLFSYLVYKIPDFEDFLFQNLNKVPCYHQYLLYQMNPKKYQTELQILKQTNPELECDFFQNLRKSNVAKCIDKQITSPVAEHPN